MFERFAALRDLFASLPKEFDAEDVGERAEISGSRRHLVLRHFAEHPAFDCRLASDRPLRARKTDDSTGDAARE